MADPDSLLTWRKQGRDVWAVNAAVSAKCFPSDSFLPCIKELLLPFSRREGSRSTGREGSRGMAVHTHTHTHSHTHYALTHENHSVPISPRFSGVRAPCLGHLSSWTLLSPEQVSLHPSLAAALQPWGLPEHSRTVLSCSNSLTASPK